MKNNNLYKVENTLRSIAKRYKTVKYSLGLAILFLMMGVSAFSEEISIQENAVPTREAIVSSRENLKNSVGSLQSKIDQARAENEKELAGLKLELIQLMEQGDQVIKMPWASWQYGMAYTYSKWNGTYKGKGDDSEVYSYQGRYVQSNDVYERNISPDSDKYSSMAKGGDITSASSTQRANLGANSTNYGLTGVQEVKEPVKGFNVSAAIRPKQVQKSPISIADKTPVTPTQPDAIRFETPTISIAPPAALALTAAAPTVNAPVVNPPTVNLPHLPDAISFSPVTPTITTPVAPSVTVTSPAQISFNAYGQTEYMSAGIDGYGLWINNHEKIDSNSATIDIDDSKMSITSGSVNYTPVAGGTVGTLATGATATSKSSSTMGQFGPRTFISTTSRANNLAMDVDITGNYTLNLNSSAVVPYFFASLNTCWYGAGGTVTFDGTLNLKNDSTLGTATLVGLRLQTNGRDVQSTGASLVNAAGSTINLYGSRSIGALISTETTQETARTNFKNEGTINVYGSQNIGIDYGMYDGFYPYVDTTVGTVNVHGANSYGLRLQNMALLNRSAYFGGTPGYDNNYQYTTVKGGRITLDKTSTESVGISVSQLIGDSSQQNVIAGMSDMQVVVGGSKNIGILRNGDFNQSTANQRDMIINSSVLSATPYFTKDASNSVLVRSDSYKTIINMNITTDSGSNNNTMLLANKGTTATSATVQFGTASDTPTLTVSNSDKGTVFRALISNNGGDAINYGTINIGNSSTGVNNSIGMVVNGTDSTGSNYGNMNLYGNNVIGVYNNGGTFTANKGTITIGGVGGIGAYNSGTKTLTVNSDATIKSTTKNTTGIFATGGTVTNLGTVNMNAASVKGLVTNGSNANIINKGSVTAKGVGAVAAASLAGTITPTTGSITVNGTSGIALYTNGGTINAVGGTINSEGGGINVYANTGTINFKGATINTGASSLAFMKGNGTVDFTNKTTANIATDGTAFYIPPTLPPSGTISYSPFTGIGTLTGFNNLPNLTLNMAKNSNVAVASYVRSDLTNLAGSSLGSLGATIVDKSGIVGGGYNDYLLYKSELTANAGSTYAQFKKVALSNSSIINNTTLSTNDNAVKLMAQENTDTTLKWVKLTNNKIITLNGTDSLAMYASNGTITNASGASITIGQDGVAIYGNNKGQGDTEIVNNGTITVGKGSTGIYATNYTTSGLENKGTINFSGNNAIGMSYIPRLTSAKVFENKGIIKSNSNSISGNTGMYAGKDSNSVRYTALNSNTISLGTSGIGMYTNTGSATTNPILSNTGTITVGNSGIGMYGYQENTTGNITVGNTGIAMYSQGGAITVGSASTSPTITVGNTNATAVFTTGSGQNVTSTNAKYNIGSNSYGFVNTGANTLNITGGTATLTDNGVFIYSSSTAGNITNKTAITSTGNKGSNLAIFSAGTVNNSGNITLTKGTGNIGVYARNNGTITNSGTITLGASTSTNRSIGAIANGGTVNNNGNIVVNGKYGVGLYATGNISKINNSKNISLTGDETIGAYGAANSNISLTSGTVTLTGNNSTGYYSAGGTNSKIASGATINVTGKSANGVYTNNNGVLTYNGDTTVKGDAAYGMIIDGNSTINATSGKVTIGGATTGTSSNAIRGVGGRGAAALVVMQGSNLTGNGLEVTADVSGANSVGIYSKGNLQMKSADVKAYNGAVNFFADQNGTISIGNNGGTVTAVTGIGNDRGSLLFYTPGGKILINGNMNATIQGSTNPTTRGTAFYYTGSGTLGSIGTYTALSPSNVATWARASFGNGTTATLGKLTLNMQANSRLFLTQKVNMDLSNTSISNLFSGLSTSERPNVTGTGYRSFMLYQSHLNINQAVNLDNANDSYNQVEVSNSSITNNNTITGTQANQIAIAQENASATAPKSTVTLTNKGTVTLSGVGSAAIYAKNGIVDNANNGKITVGEKSTALYGLDNTQISNTGNITVGNSSTAMFYSDIYKDSASKETVYNTINGLKNDGTITLNGDNAVGMTYEAGNISGTRVFENAGTITSTKDKNVGMYAKVARNGSYNTVNSKTITLGDSSSLNNPNVAIYTNASRVGTNPITNTGNITVGKNSVGLYGVEETNTGNITVGDASVAMYSKGGNVNLNGGTITTGAKEAVGVYTVGNNQTITNNSTTFNLGDTSFGFVNVGTGNTIQSKVSNVSLANDSVYIYSNKNGTIINNTNITSTGARGQNYGIYAAGNITNSGNMNLNNGLGNIGIYTINNGTARNTGTISVGGSDATNEIYGVGMAAGYVGDSNTPATSGRIENSGTINVNGASSIGMYGAGAGTVVTNRSNIILNANNTTGIYVENGAKAENYGVIRTGTSGLSNVSGVVLGKNSTLYNYNLIDIDATGGVGVYFKGGIIANEGTINVRGNGSQKTFRLNNSETTKGIGKVAINAPAGATTATITENGVQVQPTIITTAAEKPVSVSASSIGLYVNTSGKTYTNAINNLGALTSEADLIIGSEAAGSTLSKYIQINDNKILGSYNNAITNGGVSKWNIYAGSLTWMATPTLNSVDGSIQNLYMAKIPYTEWASESKATPVDRKDTYNFTDGLEQRYGIKELGSRENEVFQRLNTIGNNEEILLYQAFDEMMGHQYSNVQQRINATGNILDKELTSLKGSWSNLTKDSNKIKTFGTKGEYKTDTAGVIDYKYNAYGVAYVHENEDIKLGRSIGWYTGIVHNTFKFKDIGNSKEQQLQAKVGIFKSVPFDDNNSLNWTISADVFAGYNNMHRKFLVVDEVFNAKAKYYNYGIGLKNELGKEFRLSESFSLRPYIALGLEYGRVSKIKEKSGEIKLEVKQNDYISIRPEVGTELAYKHHFGVKTLRTGLAVAYENELGRVAKGKNKARVADTNADWFNIRGEKEDRKGNVKFDLNVGLDNQRYGVTANVGYDTKGENLRGGLGLRVIF